MEDENMGPELLDKLREEWQLKSAKQPHTVQFLQQSVKKAISSNGLTNYNFVAFFNK